MRKILRNLSFIVGLTLHRSERAQLSTLNAAFTQKGPVVITPISFEVPTLLMATDRLLGKSRRRNS